MKPIMVINSNGSKVWRLNGKLHREDGPAYEWVDGTKEWWINGNYISNSCAIELPNGTKYYTFEGKLMTEQEWLDRVLFDKVIIKEF